VRRKPCTWLSSCNRLLQALLRPAVRGDSSKLRVGQQVLAIGEGMLCYAMCTVSLHVCVVHDVSTPHTGTKEQGPIKHSHPSQATLLVSTTR
jgi:hypothetical protein